MKQTILAGAFDDLRFRDFRLLEEASKLGGALHINLWSDRAVERSTGKPPKFPEAERNYLLSSIRFVSSVQIVDDPVSSHVSIPQSQLEIVPPSPSVPENPQSSRKKVVVTGCYDWFHSGHVRFFEECAELGDLYVVVGHDANIRLLKGEGHPLFPAAQRRYMAGAIRFCKLAMISTGNGWMDAEPEFLRIKPDIYVVNEDGDKPEKSAFCVKNGIEYRVLKREPKKGLPRRESTKLRGF